MANRPKSRLSDLEIENKNIDYQTSTLGNNPSIYDLAYNLPVER